MRRSLFVIALLFAPAAMAINIGDTTVIIPIIGRFPGAGGTQWRTDVFIANHGSLTKNAIMTFYVAGGTPMQSTTTLAPYSTASFRDIVLNTFNLSNASGQLEVRSSIDSLVEARARIYNAGSAVGEFGQNVAGIGLAYLNRQSFLFGLSGINGNRVNVGVANPNAEAVAVEVRITDKNNVQLASQSLTLQPHETQQLNDIFTRFGIAPQADVQVEINSISSTTNQRIYGYASEVRNDTGDAIFIFGTSPNS